MGAEAVKRTLSEKKGFASSAFYLFDVLTVPKWLTTSISPEDLDARLVCIANCARAQNRMRQFKDTRDKLRAPQPNQVLGALFEIVLLSDLIRAVPTVEVFPSIPGTNGIAEARLVIEKRHIYVEAKALGHTKSDFHGPVGTRSKEQSKAQVRRAIESKTDGEGQIAALCQNYPTVLCLALGFNAGIREATWAINDFLTAASRNVSCLFVAESSFALMGMKPFTNDTSSLKLTKTEFQKLCECFDSARHKEYRRDDYEGED